MKPVGRSPKAFTEIELKMIKEYLQSDKSLKEVATKYGVSEGGLRYKVVKYKKEKQQNAEVDK